MKLRSCVAALAVVALSVAVPTVSSAAPVPDPVDRFAKAPTDAVTTAVKPRAVQTNKKVDVIVQLTGDPVAVAEAKAGSTFTPAKRDKVKAKLRSAQNTLGKRIQAKGGSVTYRMQSAYNGVRVRIPSSKVSSLAGLPGVKSVQQLTPKALSNTESVPYIGTGTAWQTYGKTGKGVKVAIIDTGIDYTHADFGGPGTPAAYADAKAKSAQAADPKLFGPGAPRVKGGYDFVGDDYNADGTTEAVTTPKPDPNPLDCEGHGSHVAGTAAGSGVTTDGKTYAGPYTKSTEQTPFKVGPGVAPQADLYALRVIGCNGTTTVVAEAIDWAVDHGMDVINMSLGGPFGRSDDPDAVAASNAVAAGVVVVASAGNEGPAPYIVGSPSVGQGVISVAAVDSIGSFPGAALQSGSVNVKAINANNETLPSGEFKIVALTDKDNGPTDTVQESLGCSVKAFTDAFAAAGVTASDTVIAVVTRGDCGRAAKAVYGQQAGADAVVMINNAEGYPPYEGQITTNPDDNSPFTVTIPFLGVTPADGAKLIGLAGKTLTMAPTTVDNPNYGDYAGFSSGGPVNGDSGLSPSVAAPGVSISSVAVGTGTDATVLSGTSMASPHVAGVAALAVQAHPTWKASQIASAVVATSDPDKIVKANSITEGGAGLVDPAQAVATQTLVTGDSYVDASGRVWEDSLSFGFAESNIAFVKTRKITITNTGRTPVVYTLSSKEDGNSVDGATIRLSANRVVVPGKGSVTVRATLLAAASSVPSSIADPDDHFNFSQISGEIVLTASDKSVLRVPYLLVPRASSQLTASLAHGPRGGLDALTGGTAGSVNVNLANFGGALTATADFYSLGLTDKADKKRRWGGSGYDLRAAGVQSFDDGGDKLLVFAVNNYDRWSNAATNEFDVLVDVDGDGSPDYAVFSYDEGYQTVGEYNGTTAVWVYDFATGTTTGSGYYAVSPTDSSTLLLPVNAASIGVKATGAKAGAFGYTVQSFSLEDSTASDSFDTWATYNPWAKAVADGDYQTVKPNRVLSVPVGVNPAEVAKQKAKGVLVVSFDNRSGADEARVLTFR